MIINTRSEGQNPSRVVILGAGGFVGRRLATNLRADEITVLAPSSKELDLSSADAGSRLSELLHPHDTVVFLSAITPDKGRGSDVLIRNLMMGRSICTATRSRRPSQLIYASSDAVYSFNSDVISETSEAAPVNLYGAMHRTREIMLAIESEAPVAVLRFTAIYGAGDTHHSYGPNRFVAQALEGKNISLFGDGEELRDHLFIDDAVEIVRRVMAFGSIGLMNVASGSSISFRAAAELIAKARPGVTIESSPRKSSVTHRRFDIANTMAAFPDLRFTAIDVGLNSALARK